MKKLDFKSKQPLNTFIHFWRYEGMKKLLALAIVALFVLPIVANAGIDGTEHDMVGFAQGTFKKELCQACHLPHNAGSDKLWAQGYTTTYSDLRDLCVTCHDGSIATSGTSGTGYFVFSTTSINHIPTNGSACSGPDACHDIHNQLSAGNNFLKVSTSVTVSGSYCASCHNNTTITGVGGTPVADKTGTDNHVYGTYGTETVICETCHYVHGAADQTGTTPDSYILRADNATPGDICVSCHNSTSTDVNDAWDYNLTDGSMHPITSATYSSTFGDGCESCHTVHGGSGTYVLKADNLESAYCTSCHNGTTGPAVGNSHPMLAAANTSAAGITMGSYPISSTLDEDGDDVYTGVDFGSTNDYLICESCHSVHKSGVAGTKLLRGAMGAQNTLCDDCHAQN